MFQLTGWFGVFQWTVGGLGCVSGMGGLGCVNGMGGLGVSADLVV